jgi:hypothetical protein
LGLRFNDVKLPWPKLACLPLPASKYFSLIFSEKLGKIGAQKLPPKMGHLTITLV